LLAEDQIPTAALGAGVLVILIPFARHLYRIYHLRALSSTAPPELQAITVHIVDDINAKLRLCVNKTLEVHILKRSDGQPVSIVQRYRKLVIVFRPDFAALAILKPRVAGALLAHKLSHPFQWDTRFGHFWCQTSIVAFGVLVAGSLLGVAILGGAVLFHVARHESADVKYVLPYFELQVFGVAFSFLILAWCFRIRRWIEYAADLSAVLVGYGVELMSLLELRRPQERPFRDRYGFSSYPSNAARLKRLTKYLGKVAAPETSQSHVPMEVPHEFVVAHANLRIKDYAYALITRVVPFMLPMGLLTDAYVTLADRMGGMRLPLY
jgi:hypothetical protein